MCGFINNVKTLLFNLNYRKIKSLFIRSSFILKHTTLIDEQLYQYVAIYTYIMLKVIKCHVDLHFNTYKNKKQFLFTKMIN